MENYVENKIESRISRSSLLDVFQSSLPLELNIYNQAHLEIETPLLENHKSSQKSNKEIGVSFQLSGDLQGKIYCFLDITNKRFLAQEGPFFNSLFIESLNILTGQMVTNLENRHDVNTTISNPSFFEQNNEVELSVDRSNLLLSADAKFITIHGEFDCSIVLDIKK